MMKHPRQLLMHKYRNLRPSLARVKRAFSFLGRRETPRQPGRVPLLALAALMLAVMLPDAAFAQNMIAAPGDEGVWTVYAFGNAAAISTTFQSLYNFTASALFQSVVSVVAVLGVLAVGMTGGFNQAVARRFIGYSVAVFLVCYCLFGVGNGGPLVVQVEVEDVVDGTWQAPVTVPAVIGIPAAMISTAGYDLTAQIEASFQLPAGMLISNGAPFDMAAAMLSDASQADITDPNLASSLSYYVQDCVIPAIEMGYLTSDVLINSTNFIQDMQVNLQSIYVNSLLVTGQVGIPDITTCAQDWSYINSAFASTDAGDYFKSASAWAQTPALSVLDSAFDTVAQWSSNGVLTSGGNAVQQAAVLNAFNGAFTQTAAATGNSDFLTSMAVTQAEKTQQTSWIVGAEVFNHMMGYVFAVLQVFIYTLIPLILMVVLVPGLGLALFKNFGQILLWLAMWQPLLAIVNFIVLSMQQSDLTGIMSNGLGSYGFTMTSIGVISQKTANLRAAAMFVGTMTPVLAWAMVKGSIDFSRVIGTAVGEHFAQSAANTMVSGNYSLNTGSADNYSANKTSVAANNAEGHGMNFDGQAGTETRNWGGTAMHTANGVTAQGGTSTQTTVTKTATTGSQGAVSTAGGSSYNASSSGGTGSTSAEFQQGGTNTNAGVARSDSGQVSGSWGGGGAGSAPGGMPGTDGGAGNKKGPMDSLLGLFGHAVPSVRPSVSASAQAQSGTGNSSANGVMAQRSGTSSEMGSAAVTGNTGTSISNTAAEQVTTQTVTTTSVSAPPSNAMVAADAGIGGVSRGLSGMLSRVTGGPEQVLGQSAAQTQKTDGQLAGDRAGANSNLEKAKGAAAADMGAGKAMAPEVAKKMEGYTAAANESPEKLAKEHITKDVKAAGDAAKEEVEKLAHGTPSAMTAATIATPPTVTPDGMYIGEPNAPVQPPIPPGGVLGDAPGKSGDGASGSAAAPSGGAVAEGKVHAAQQELKEVGHVLHGAENLNHGDMTERVKQAQDVINKKS